MNEFLTSLNIVLKFTFIEVLIIFSIYTGIALWGTFHSLPKFGLNNKSKLRLQRYQETRFDFPFTYVDGLKILDRFSFYNIGILKINHHGRTTYFIVKDQYVLFLWHHIRAWFFDMPITIDVLENLAHREFKETRNRILIPRMIIQIVEDDIHGEDKLLDVKLEEL